MLYAIVAVIILIFDQALKYWVTRNIALDSGLSELLPGFISVTRSHNYGAAFSILQNARVLFIVLTVIFIIIAISLLFMNAVRGGVGRWSLVMVLAGATGNGIDRVIQGYVVDMFRFEFITFPIFNVADIFITLGGISFCLYVIFHKDPWLKKTETVDTKRFSAPRKKLKRGDPPSFDPESESFAKPVNPDNPFGEWLDRKYDDKSAETLPDPGLIGASPEKPAAANGFRNAPVDSRVKSSEFADETPERWSIDDILEEFRAGDEQ